MSAAGDYVRNSLPTGSHAEDTTQANITNTGYAGGQGDPECGVFFVAPPSGVVRLSLGGGFRDNGGSIDRIFLAPQVFLEDSGGEEVLAPSVTFRGYLSVAQDTEFQYGTRVSLLEDLTPGRRYYIRTMFLATPGTDPDTADIAARDLIVIPMP
jgi:hypothetical protein